MSCSDVRELSGGCCSPMDGSCSNSSAIEPTGEEDSRVRARWPCCRSAAAGLRDVSCADSNGDD